MHVHVNPPVLVIDDEPQLGESMAKRMQEAGYQVAVCRSAEDARDELRRGTYKVLFVDFEMSGITGPELLRLALAGDPQRLVIVMTADVDHGAIISAMDSGSWNYLSKPFTASHMLLMLSHARHVLEQRRTT